MKLEKALEILSTECTLCTTLSNPDLKDAIHLSIEALNYVLNCRFKGYHPVEHALPGETKE